MHRFKRAHADVEEAYSKYYQRIKQKYYDFVKYMLGYNSGAQDVDTRRAANKIKIQNGRLYYISNYTEHLPRYKTTQSRQTLNNINLNEFDDIENKAQRMQMQLPKIDYESKSATLRRTNEPIVSEINNYILDSSPNMKLGNVSDFIEKLKAQIIRKRNRRSANIQIDNDSDSPDENKEGRKRLRGPCEDLDWDSFANVTILRAGKTSGRNSVGTILSLECNAGFQLNIKGENATTRCIRGFWKPETPKCISGKKMFITYIYTLS